MGRPVALAIGTMRAIESRSARIADIPDAIDRLACQTHLPALDAAVEAARARQQGCGLSMVAQAQALVRRVSNLKV